MRNLIFKGKATYLIFPLIFIFLTALLTSCAKKMHFAISSIVPAAEGRVKIKSDQNNNKTIDVEIKNLARVQRLEPSRDHYVVWMETESNGVQNLGRLKSTSSLFSSSMTGNLKTVTAFDPVSFFITAENNATIQYPGNFVVLSTN